MNPLVELNLALILFLPWYLLLGWLHWRLTTRGADGRRKLVSLGVLVAAFIAAGFAGTWAFHRADPGAGAIWKQVLASAVGYGAFLAVLAPAFLMLRRSRPPGSR